jgi:hypothetical protein
VARTLLVSDLHLGSRAGSDVLRREGVLEELLGALEGIDRLVLLGDTLELRQGRVRDVLDRSRAVLGRLGERMAGRHIVLIPGNHDHALIWRGATAARPGSSSAAPPARRHSSPPRRRRCSRPRRSSSPTPESGSVGTSTRCTGTSSTCT